MENNLEIIMSIKIELRKARPLLYSYKGKEKYEENKWQGYDTLVLITEDKNREIFLKVVKNIILETMVHHEIVLRFAEISQSIMENIKAIFSIHPELKVYPAKKNKIYTPGMIISTISTDDEFDKALNYWGSVDFFQIIAIDKQVVNSVTSLLEEDVYELSVKALLLILEYCNFVLTDSGDGNEAEIIYPIKNEKMIKDLILNACEEGLDITEK